MRQLLAGKDPLAVAFISRTCTAMTTQKIVIFVSCEKPGDI
jgi:hypothetical protein